MCTLCGKYRGRYHCEGCDFIDLCGHCARLVFVVCIHHIMKQRLCPFCRMSGDSAMENGIFDARHFTKEYLQQMLGLLD